MTYRVLRGRRSDGSLGFDISKPGFDVRTADKMHMAFSSDLKIPKVVVAGQAIINPVNGTRVKDLGIPGAMQSVLTVPFGASLPVIPVVVAIAKCAYWQIPLNIGNRNIALNLWGQFISPIYENFSQPTSGANDLTYGTPVNHGNLNDSNSVSIGWHACQFTITTYYSYFQIIANIATPMTVKYLALRYP